MKEKLDFKKLGFKCGIEIHQQLDTSKLFCNCPSLIRDDKPDYIIKRNLKAVIGESGDIDSAALHEQKKSKYYLYQGYTDTTCLVELDEEPPHIINKKALEITLQTSLMLNSKIVDEVQVMRKIVVDGSNTSGFQRTALVARNGFIDTSQGRVGIPAISIEEDAAKIIKRTKDYDIYNLSRLGIPLAEIATDPDIKSPSQVKETAQYLGMVLRSTGHVKRGLGTIRQDVNVSIKGGVRVEIKGAQDLKNLPKLVENEAIRQMNLINFPKNPKISDIIDFTKTLSKTKSKVLRKALDNNGSVMAIKVASFANKFKENVQPYKRFGAELSDYAKSTAGVGGLFHSDELPNYGITQKEVDIIKQKLKVGKNDAFILIADNKAVANNALLKVKYRLKHPLVTEVRRANEDSTTTFLRPMPGAARMYPETDTIPIIPDINNIKLPELISDKIKRYEKEYNLSNDLAAQIVRYVNNFEEYVKKYKKLQPQFIADTIINVPKEIKKRYSKTIKIEKHINTLFTKLSNNDITKEAIFEILVDIANSKPPDYKKYKPIDDKQIEKEIKSIIDKNKEAPFGALMGIIMGKFRGKVDGKTVSQFLKKYAK